MIIPHVRRYTVGCRTRGTTHKSEVDKRRIEKVTTNQSIEMTKFLGRGSLFIKTVGSPSTSYPPLSPVADFYLPSFAARTSPFLRANSMTSSLCATLP